MKREKRHGIERELSIKRIRSQKKYSILIVSVLLLTCTLIQIGFQMSEGLKAAYIENRKAVYGEWEQVFLDMDESSVKVAEENPFLAQTGKISIYGAIAGDYLENRQMNIGTMDETAWKLGRLEMKEGRLPENEHEIVMEYSTLMEISTRQEELKVYQRLTGNGYYLSTMEITNSPGISRQTVDKLEQVAGVTSVEQYHNNEKEEFWIDLSEYAESEYFQKVVETLVAYLNETSIKEKISIEKVRLSLLTIDRWQDIQRFLRNLDEGSLTKEEFEQGDFCILDLTELQEYDGKYLSAVSPDGQGISEDTVQVGDELLVYTLNENGSRNENPIPVTAILRGMKEEDVRNPQIGGSGISMIVGKNFWKKFGKSRIMEYDQIVKILVSDDADAYDTEGHILSILKQGTAVNVQNNHEEYKKIRQELYSFIGMYSIFAVFYMILISIVLYQMFLAEKQEEKREGEILQSLGMEEKFLKKMHRIEVLWMTGCAGVIGVLTLWGACRLI